MNNTFRNTVVQMSIDVPFNPFLGKLGPKKSKLSVLPEIGMHGISRMLILIPALDFSIFNPKSIFGQNWAEKVKVVRFA